MCQGWGRLKGRGDTAGGRHLFQGRQWLSSNQAKVRGQPEQQVQVHKALQAQAREGRPPVLTRPASPPSKISLGLNERVAMRTKENHSRTVLCLMLGLAHSGCFQDANYRSFWGELKIVSQCWRNDSGVMTPASKAW